MAATIQVAGPTVVYIGEDILGYSDNDNLPAVAFSDFIHEVKTVMSGAVPEELVLQNTSATITLTLVKWDEAIYEGMLTTQRGVYNTTTVGSQLVSGSHTFALSLESVSGNATYTFNRCYIQPDGISDAQWGNRERTLTLTIKAIPDQDNELFIYSNTAPPAP
jgi:hypothetical protein